MIGKQVLAFGKSEKSEFINIGIYAASSGGRKERGHIGRFTPDRERSHVCLLFPVGGGGGVAVVTNDWCIMSKGLEHEHFLLFSVRKR